LHEFETTKYIAAFLDELGVQYDRPLETGLIAYLPGNGNHTIAYRADIDALPIYEENDVSYRSETDHVMHACGHDGHRTALIIFVKRCETITDQGTLPQYIVFIFQPAAETGGGAIRLIRAGALDKYPIGAIFGIDVMRFADEGRGVIRDEEITASDTEYR